MTQRERIFKTILRERTLEDLILLLQTGPAEEDLAITDLERDAWVERVREVAKEKFNPAKA